MSTYLELAVQLCSKCRVSGDGPVAVTGQNKEYMRILGYVNEAWMKIQNRRTDWRFMRASTQVNSQAGKLNYDPAADFGLTDFGYWALDHHAGDTFRVYKTAAGITSETFLEVWDYDWWRDAYLFGGNRTAFSYPLGVARAPDDSLVFGPIMADGYTVIGDYYRRPTKMVNAADVPVLPEQFHDAIIYLGMMLYGASEAAPEIYDDGYNNFQEIIRQVESQCLRRLTLGGALC